MSRIWSMAHRKQHDIYVLIPFCVGYSQAHSLRRFKKDNLKSITIRSASAISKIEKQMQSALPNGIYWITHCLIAVYQRFYIRSNKFFVWLARYFSNKHHRRFLVQIHWCRLTMDYFSAMKQIISAVFKKQCFLPDFLL